MKFFEATDDINLKDSLGQNKFDELGKIKKKLNGELDTTVEWDNEIDFETVALRYYEYQNDIKVIDFNEILYRSYKIINENEFVAKSLSSKFYEILIDEFQDTNIYQYEIFKKINNAGKCTFFMVGDDRQKIFTFAGAIDNSFEKAETDFNAQLEVLTEAYRSTSNIVESYSNLFFDHPVIENQSPYKDLNIPVHIIKTEKANHDNYLRSLVKNLIEDKEIPISKIAILSTSWFAAFPASEVLRQDYNIVGLGALPHKSLYNSTFSLLKYLSRYYFAKDIKSLKAIKRSINRHLSENNLIIPDNQKHQKTNKLITEFLKINTEDSIDTGISFCKTIFDRIFQKNHSAFDEILELIPIHEKKTWNIGQYIKTLSGLFGIMNTTIHKAKGLEFDAVILNSMNEKKIPHQKLISKQGWIYQDLTDNDIKEGKNLFYVAMSRAKKYLIILHNWKPSMFIEMLNIKH